MPVTDSSHTLKEAAEADAKVILKKYEDICKSKNVRMHLKGLVIFNPAVGGGRQVRGLKNF